MAKRSDAYATFYATATGQPLATPLSTLEQIVGSVAVQGASQVVYSKKGGAQKFSITPATPVAPVTPYVAPAPVTPGFFQKVRPDGSIGTNWGKVAIVAGAGVAFVAIFVAARGNRK
jgi:hypothetical protein